MEAENNFGADQSKRKKAVYMSQSGSEIITEKYGLILSENSKSTYYPESLMPPDDRFFACEFAFRGNRVEIVYSYYSKGDSIMVVIGGL